MSWLFMRSIAPHHTPREYLNAQFTHTSETMTRTVLRSAAVKMRTYYAALEILRPEPRREVVGIVCLIKYNKRDREGYVFGYRDMSEDMGPCESECPVAILDLLIPRGTSMRATGATDAARSPNSSARNCPSGPATGSPFRKRSASCLMPPLSHL